MATNARDIEISELPGFEEVAAFAANRPLFHFSFVQSFHYSVSEDSHGEQWSDVDLVMRELEAPYAQVGIRFHRVAVDSFSGFGQIMGLYFQSIQDRGWERLCFEVGDYEDGHIHLFCHAISLFDPRKSAQQNHPA